MDERPTVTILSINKTAAKIYPWRALLGLFYLRIKE